MQAEPAIPNTCRSWALIWSCQLQDVISNLKSFNASKSVLTFQHHDKASWPSHFLWAFCVTFPLLPTCVEMGMTLIKPNSSRSTNHFFGVSWKYARSSDCNEKSHYRTATTLCNMHSWRASQENSPCRCHTKRRMGAHGRTHPSFTLANKSLMMYEVKRLKFWKVGVISYDNDKDLKVCFLVTHLSCLQPNCITPIMATINPCYYRNQAFEPSSIPHPVPLDIPPSPSTDWMLIL